MTLLLLPPNYYGAICDINLYFCKQSVLHFSEIWRSLCVMDISFSLWSFFAPFTGTCWYWAVSFQFLCHPAFQHEILNCSSWNICRKCHYMKFTFGLLLSQHFPLLGSTDLTLQTPEVLNVRPQDPVTKRWTSAALLYKLYLKLKCLLLFNFLFSCFMAIFLRPFLL